MPDSPTLGLALICAFLLSAADALAEDQDDDERLDAPVSEMEEMGAIVDLGIDDASTTGNFMGSLVSSWPPDLVVAPVPGYSPQVGWNLAVAAGYFLTPKDEDSKVPPSILGAFGFIAEN